MEGIYIICFDFYKSREKLDFVEKQIARRWLSVFLGTKLTTQTVENQ